MKLRDVILWVGHLLVLAALIYQTAQRSQPGVIAVALAMSAAYYVSAAVARRESFLYLGNALLSLGYLLLVRLAGTLETALLLALPLVAVLSILAVLFARRDLPRHAEACDWVAHAAGIGVSAALVIYAPRLQGHAAVIAALVLYAALYLGLMRLRRQHWFLLPASLASGLAWYFIVRALWPGSPVVAAALLAAAAVVAALKGRYLWKRGGADRSAPVHTGASVLALVATMLAFSAPPHGASVPTYLLAALTHTLVLAYTRRDEVVYLITYTLGLMAWSFVSLSGGTFLHAMMDDFLYSLLVAGAIFLYPAVRTVLRYRWSLAEWLTHGHQRVLYIGLGAVLAVLAWDATWINATAENPNFCGSCHTMQPMVATWQQSKHSQVGCDTCHYAPGVTNTIRGRITGLMMVAQTITGRYGTKAHGNVVDASCQRAGCHNLAALTNTTLIAPKVRFNHLVMLAMPQARGIDLKCVTCHTHAVEGPHFAAQPAVCYLCHLMNPKPETGVGIGTCQNCHLQTPAELQAAGRATVGNGEVDEERCLRCHLGTEGLKAAQRLHDLHITGNEDFTKGKIECFDCHRVIRHGKGDPFAFPQKPVVSAAPSQ